MEIGGYCINCMGQMGGKDPVCSLCGFHQKAYISKPHCLRPGTLLNGKYVTGRVLGHGGSGIAYLGLDLEEKRTVAVKELFIRAINTRGANQEVLTPPPDTGRFEQNRQQMLQEAAVLSMAGKTGQEGAVQLLNCFDENGTSYLVMELMEGLTLKQYIAKQGPVSFEEARRLLEPIVQVLIRLHRLGIIHKDVAPDNIMVLNTGETKLVDFGAALRLAEKSEERMVSYKRGYAPPEQYLRNGDIGPWTDVYAVAATLWFLLTGEKIPDAMDRKVGQELIPLTQLRVKISPRKEQGIDKALRMNPKERFAQMEEFHEAVFS